MSFFQQWGSKAVLTNLYIYAKYTYVIYFFLSNKKDKSATVFVSLCYVWLNLLKI